MNNQSSYQYTYKTDDIPLSKVDSFDEEQKAYYNKQQQQTHDKREPFNSIYQVKQNRFSLFLQPIFSVALSSFFSIALLLLFLHADGKTLDYTIVGMKIPSLVSLLLSINMIFIASGISKAIAEFKWVKLQNGAPLTTIDIYDACTRGLSGFLMTFRALQFDFILIVALVFNIGLFVVSPASQAILVPIQKSYNATGYEVRFYNYPPNYTLQRTKLGATGQPPLMNGLPKNAYITSSSFAQASIGTKSMPYFTCPTDATYCLYPNVSFISTSMRCQPITENDKALVYFNNTNFVVVLKEYLTNDNITRGSTVGSFPKFFYSPEMLGRTSYELDNYKQPMLAGLNITDTMASTTVYDPQYRPYVGDQSFVMAYNTHSPSNSVAFNYTELSFRKCSLYSSLNTTDWKTENGTLVKTGVETTKPIVFDYDNVLGNNVGIAAEKLLTNYTSAAMVNAYTMQQALLLELIRPKNYFMNEYLSSYGLFDDYGNATRMALNYSRIDKFESFMNKALAAFDNAYFQSPYLGGSYAASLNTQSTEGVALINPNQVYKVDKTSAYILCLCLILPIFWWVIVWLYSLKKSNGVARSSSQIVLLATNMTPDAEHSLRGFSNLDSSNAFNRAKNIRIRLGHVNQQTIVGLDHENNVRHFI